MSGLSLYSDQMVKQEQYKDLLREAERYRLIKTFAQPGPKRLQKVAVALRKAMVGPTALAKPQANEPCADLNRRVGTITTVAVQGSNPCEY